MAEKRAGSGSSDELDQTFIPGQEHAEPSAADKSAGTAHDMDATYVPESTAAPAQPSQKKETSKPAASTSHSSPEQKKSSSQLGKYKLLKKLGQGGMGEVYLAEDINLGRKAAVKVLSKALAGKEDFVTRFYKEARAMARVTHDNAVSVFDVDQDRGIHYVAMEFVDGKSMQKWMDAQKTLSVGDALHVVLRCAEALQFAHSQNLIHRDIKPDNIMLTSRGKVKVADFGLAKATDEDLSMTASGTGLGTPYYMAPEQARNAKHVDGRADVYALGVTLYYFVTGKLPFTGDSALDVIMAKEKGRYESPRKLNPQVTDRLDLTIAKMIEKDSDRRFKDCGEVIQMLSSLGLESPSLSFIDAPDKVVQTSSASSQTGRPTQRPGETARASDLGAARTSADDAAAHAARQSPAPANDAWIVQYKTPQGKDTIARMTTTQVHAALKNGLIDNRAKLKKNANDAYAPIGFFTEFERAIEGRNIKAKAEQKNAGLKSEFDKLGRQYDRRGWSRWFKGMISNTAGFISFLIWIGVVFGGLAALYYFRASIWDTVAGFINSRK